MMNLFRTSCSGVDSARAIHGKSQQVESESFGVVDSSHFSHSTPVNDSTRYNTG
jgi:hypothetical protein